MRYNKLKSSYGLGYKPVRYPRQMLTLEEVQRRLDLHYGGKLTIVEYRGARNKGILHCKECGTFETKKAINGYICNTNQRHDCELCYRKRKLEEYNSKFDVEGLEVVDFWYTKTKSQQNEIYKSQFISIHCSVCKNTFTSRTSTLDALVHCKFCEYERITKEYTEILKKYNCTYIKREVIGTGTTIHYVCDICKKPGKTSLSCFYKDGEVCSNCNPNTNKNIFINSYRETYNICKDTGRILLDYKGTNDLYIQHLFCGKKVKSFKSSLTSRFLCRECASRISNRVSYLKEHNKHLVQEYLVILKNVQTLKGFLEEHNQLDKLPASQAKTILEHIDGWINNYETIINVYPNGDLGTVLEGNPLYLKCKEIFYPIMERYNLEIK